MVASLAIAAGGVLDPRIFRGLIGVAPGIALIAIFPRWSLELNGVLCFVAFSLISHAMWGRQSPSSDP